MSVRRVLTSSMALEKWGECLYDGSSPASEIDLDRYDHTQKIERSKDRNVLLKHYTASSDDLYLRLYQISSQINFLFS